MQKIYLASSWRNDRQPHVVKLLRDAGHEVYDFRNPTPYTGFHWSDIDPGWETWDTKRFRESLSHPIADSGFGRDWGAMLWADTCVMLLPCGRSAHMEAGYFVGSGKRLIISLEGRNEPELMYKMAADIVINEAELLNILNVPYTCFR